ncbi:ABC transporter substrate-binding protein [Roseomonas nepalensis]|uniref:ABC transporter substrate-binding protein n=1 Tax=Muricoccus nepalensis TaxID=1854500 RepID=A0A502GFT1_9PROT|nr:ABC transporter substrate-binding protein [Roseomonas nepalensis]TPG59856.1 ABC transporter substrate-binding protein [Roseomonas nepalensis]
MRLPSAALGRRAALALGLAAPRLAAGAGARVLRFVPHADLGVTDPVWSGAYVTRNHALMVYDTLYGMDADYRVQPQMAQGHEVSADGLRWTIRLREGLRFHDGEPVLARDAAASLRRWGARDGFGGALLAAAEEIGALDDRDIGIRLRRPFPLLTYALGKPGSPVCAIMPERLARADPHRPVTEVVGSGPFRFLPAERLAGARVAYERNEAYLPREGGGAGLTAGPKHVQVDRVEWHVLPDPATAAAALRAGEVDWWENPGFDLLPSLARDPRVAVTPPGALGLHGALRFNQLHPPFDDPAVRRALLPAVSPADYVAAVAGDFPGGGRTEVGFFAEGALGASDEGLDVLLGPRDLEGARRALARAGAAGARVVLIAPTDVPILRAQAEVGADLLRRVGFEVDVQALDWATAFGRLARQDPPAQGGWNVVHTWFSGLDMLDPAVHPYLRGNGREGRIGWPVSPRIEALRDAWLEAGSPGERDGLARALQRQAFEDLPYIPIGAVLPRAAHRRGLAGVPPGLPTFWGVRWA